MIVRSGAGHIRVSLRWHDQSRQCRGNGRSIEIGRLNRRGLGQVVGLRAARR